MGRLIIFFLLIERREYATLIVKFNNVTRVSTLTDDSCLHPVKFRMAIRILGFFQL